MMAGRRGKLVVISAPSGAGKTTIAHEIMKRNPSLTFSVSATTRPRRASEVDGRDYHFLGAEEFRRRVAAGDFVEWEEVFGNYYGTLRGEIERALEDGRDVVFDVDVKGALSIKQQYPEALLIFISPPSIETLRERLVKRRTEDAGTLQRRLDRVAMEMEKRKQFDYEVVNDVLEEAVEEVQRLVEHHLRKNCVTSKG